MKRIVLIILSMLSLPAAAQVQNNSIEVRDYTERNGHIIIPVIVNGVEADFILDLSTRTFILPEYAVRLGLEMAPNVADATAFPYRDMEITGSAVAARMSFGNSAFSRETRIFVVRDAPYLREINVAGVVGMSFMRNTVLTIDARRKKLTMSKPYRPTYIGLSERQDFQLAKDHTMTFDVQVDGKPVNVLLDMWSTNCVELTPAQFSAVKGGKASGAVARDFGPADVKTEGKIAAGLLIAKTELKNVTVVQNPLVEIARAGAGLFEYGLVCFDFDRQKMYFQPHEMTGIVEETVPKVTVTPGKVNPITNEYFLENIFDYKNGKEFKYKGNKPVVIDFWATWCGPCMRMMPDMERLAAKYKDDVLFLKVNADVEQELCNVFGIKALPTLMFITRDGRMTTDVGALPDKCEQTIIHKLLRTDGE